MSEKQLIIKDSIKQVFDTEFFKQYILLRDQIMSDPQFLMYVYILENKQLFSEVVVTQAKLKIIKKKSSLKVYTKEIDLVLNELLSLYESE